MAFSKGISKTICSGDERQHELLATFDEAACPGLDQKDNKRMADANPRTPPCKKYVRCSRLSAAKNLYMQMIRALHNEISDVFGAEYKQTDFSY